MFISEAYYVNISASNGHETLFSRFNLAEASILLSGSLEHTWPCKRKWINIDAKKVLKLPTLPLTLWPLPLTISKLSRRLRRTARKAKSTQEDPD